MATVKTNWTIKPVGFVLFGKPVWTARHFYRYKLKSALRYTYIANVKRGPSAVQQKQQLVEK